MSDWDDDGPQPMTRRAKSNVELRPAGEVLPEVPAGVEGGDDEPVDVWAARERQQLYEEAADARRERSGIPVALRELSFDDLDVSESRWRAAAVAAAAAWARGEERGLVLTGPVGIGKTRIAATAAWARARLAGLRWLPVAELLMALSESFSSPARERAMRRLDPGRSSVALVMDDLDKVRPTDHALQPLYVAVNAWVDAGQPLLVTTNRSLDSLADDFGERFGVPIASRLAEHCIVAELTGRDRRVEP